MARTYTVPDISCGHCKETIESRLTQVDGVTSVAVDIDTKGVTVEGDVDEETVADALDEVGFEIA